MLMKIVTHLFITTILIVFVASESFSQGDKKHIREGNKHFEKSEFENSEISYRKALEEESKSFNALFNLGDALYKQEKFDDAAGEFNTLSQTGNDRRSRANSFHNLGNSLLKANKIEESIQAYKNSLRNYPDDLETKYNLSYAQDLLKKQQEQQQQQDKDKEKENQDDQNKEQQQNKDQQEDKEDQQKDQQKSDNQDQQQQEQQPQKISKEDAERLLEAMAIDEKELQEKLKKAAARKKKIVTKKNW